MINVDLTNLQCLVDYYNQNEALLDLPQPERIQRIKTLAIPIFKDIDLVQLDREAINFRAAQSGILVKTNLKRPRPTSSPPPLDSLSPLNFMPFVDPNLPGIILNAMFEATKNSWTTFATALNTKEIHSALAKTLAYNLPIVAKGLSRREIAPLLLATRTDPDFEPIRQAIRSTDLRLTFKNDFLGLTRLQRVYLLAMLPPDETKKILNDTATLLRDNALSEELMKTHLNEVSQRKTYRIKRQNEPFSETLDSFPFGVSIQNFLSADWSGDYQVYIIKNLPDFLEPIDQALLIPVIDANLLLKHCQNTDAIIPYMTEEQKQQKAKTEGLPN